MSILTRPILEINLNNLLENYFMLAKLAHTAIPAAVVKDDAYGLGAEIVAKMLYDKANCRHFFVAHAVEGQKITKLVPEATIFVLQGVGEDSIEVFKSSPKLIPVISSPLVVQFWLRNRPDDRKPAIQIETGLNRLGFREDELAALSSQEREVFGMVMSHLACGDEKDHFMNAHQIEHQNMVRLGAAMYGINTAPYRQNQMKNVVCVKAPVLQIANLPKGDFVGYSATYRASSKRKIAIVSIGYGDGVPRSLSNVGKIFFKNNGHIAEARIIGRVSMDNIICDVSDVENLNVGDVAYLAGDFYTLDDVARDAGTISYEIMSRLGKNTRFDKKYIG